MIKGLLAWAYLLNVIGNARRRANIVLMLVQRLRRWPNIKTALKQGLACAG